MGLNTVIRRDQIMLAMTIAIGTSISGIKIMTITAGMKHIP